MKHLIGLKIMFPKLSPRTNCIQLNCSVSWAISAGQDEQLTLNKLCDRMQKACKWRGDAATEDAMYVTWLLRSNDSGLSDMRWRYEQHLLEDGDLMGWILAKMAWHIRNLENCGPRDTLCHNMTWHLCSDSVCDHNLRAMYVLPRLQYYCWGKKSYTSWYRE